MGKTAENHVKNMSFARWDVIGVLWKIYHEERWLTCISLTLIIEVFVRMPDSPSSICEKILPDGESNPGLPRDRRGYLPLYYLG